MANNTAKRFRYNVEMREARKISLLHFLGAVGLVCAGLGLTRAPFVLEQTYLMPQELEGCLWGIIVFAGWVLGIAVATFRGISKYGPYALTGAMVWPFLVFVALVMLGPIISAFLTSEWPDDSQPLASRHPPRVVVPSW